MPTQARRFDSYLPGITADKLKQMVRLWGGSSQLRKDECIALISAGLNSPARCAAAVEALAPFERNALALIKAAGGVIDGKALTLGLRASGFDPGQHARHYYNDSGHNTLLNSLTRRGLILVYGGHDPTYFDSYGDPQVFSDERLLAHVGAPQVVPLTIKPMAQQPVQSISRRPQNVALDLIGVWQAIEDLGGIGITQGGKPRTHDLRKLNKAMGWSEDTILLDGLPFRAPGQGIVYALIHAGLLVNRNGLLAPTEPASAFAARPYAEQARQLLKGFTHAGEWDERVAQPAYFHTPSTLVQARQALVIGLRALPERGTSFFAINGFEQALYERIGHHFSFSYLPYRPYDYGKTAEQMRAELAAWETDIRARWVREVLPWLTAALSSWLYLLGIVELALKDGQPVAVRLTDLGRAVLYPGHGHLARPVTEPATGHIWVVQPNFEVLAYLERINPQQLAFLEGHAERLQAGEHVAQYRLTRASVYRALENGARLDVLINELEAGAGRPLPQNVAAEIREWAALREQITVYRRAKLLEYPDRAGRDAAIAGVRGAPIGDRFLLVARADAVRPAPTRRVDYAQPLAKCLLVNEEGVLTRLMPPDDLLLDAQLDRWAERLDAGRWQLTRASVSAAAAGLPISELLRLLADRLAGALPPWLEVALRAWAGETIKVVLADAVVLQVSQPAIFAAITTSPKLRPFLRGELAPDLLLLDRARVEVFRKELQWAGLTLTEDLMVKRTIAPVSRGR